MNQTQTRCRARFGARLHRPVLHRPVVYRPVQVILGIYCLLGISGAATLAAQSSPPQIAKVEAVGVDVEVALFPGVPGPLPGGLEAVVESPRCGEVGRGLVSTSSGSSGGAAMISVLVPNVLSQVLACGTQYVARLEDSAGTVGLDLPFRVDVSCHGTFQCDFRIFPWIEIENALAFSSQLDLALASSTGSGDLVGSVLGASPHLRDEVASYALHLDGWLTGQGVTLGNGCSCQWTGSLEETAPALLGGVPMLSALVCHERPFESRVAATTLTTATRCHTLGTGPGAIWMLPGGQVLTMPAFDRCPPPPDTPTTSHFRSTFEGRAAAGGDLGFLAESAIQVDFAFGQQIQTSAAAAAYRSATDPSPLDVDFLTLDSGWTTAASGTVMVATMAEITVSGTISPPPLVGAWAGGYWSIEATNGGMQAWILKKQPGSPLDVYDEGADPETCGDVTGLWEHP